MKHFNCTCGDSDEKHVDGEFQCFVVDCGCKEFELADHLE